MRISSWVGGRWHTSRWVSTPVPRRSRAGCGGTACSATRASRSLFPTTSLASRPGLPLPGLGAPICPSPFARGTRGGGVVGARAGPGGDSWWARVHLHVSTRGQPRGPPPTPFPGGGFLLAGNPGVGPPFRQARAQGGGRIKIINVKGGMGKSVTWRGGRKQRVTAQRERTGEASGGHVLSPPHSAPPLPAPAGQEGEGGAGPGRGRPARNRTEGRGTEGEWLSEIRRTERKGEEGG